MNPSEIEELKGSLKQIDDKFDRLIEKIEECKELNDKIHQTVKHIIWGIESEQENK